MEQETAERLAQLAKRTDRQMRLFYGRQPQAIGKVLGQLLQKSKYTASNSSSQLHDAWIKVASEIVGPAMASRSRATGVRRGKLEVTVAHAALSQELSFEQHRLVAALRKAIPETKILGVKYRVGQME